MKRRLLKILSFTMMLAMVISTLQVTLAVMAADINAEDTAFDSALNNSDFVSNDKFETADTADTTQYESVAYVIGEDESLRKENEKHFRMSDGTYVAAVYPEAVHYLEDDEWKEIDNTLSLTEDGYVNTENDFEVTFSSDRNSNELYTLTDGEHSVKLILKTNTENDSAVYSLRPSNGRIISVEADEENIDVSFDVKSPVESVDIFKKANPDATDEEIKEIVSAQNEENKRQREFMLQPKKLNSSLDYENVVGNVDIEYIVTPSSVKENIILETANDGNVFEFILETDLEAVLNNDGTIDLIDDESIIFSMPAPYMYDASGETSTDVEYSLKTENGKTVLTVIADDNWITSHARIFPVTIDPTISSGKTNEHNWNIVTRHISDNNYNVSNQGSSDWFMGYASNQGNYYAFLQVNDLPYIPYDCKYTGASISMYMKPGRFIPVGANSFNVIMQEALPSWTTQFGSNAVANSNPILDYQTITTSTRWVTFDITDVALKWYDDENTNLGLVFTPKLTDGSSMTQSKYAYTAFQGCVNTSPDTANMPYYCLYYRNFIGVEDYYSYHTVSAGRGGAIAISDYTGYVTLSRTLATGTGFNLVYTYNSPYGDKFFTANDVYNTVDYTNMLSARGWRLNVQQSVVEKSLMQNVDGELIPVPYLIYSDGDGTEHYFHKITDSIYMDEDGLGLTITKESDGITFTLSDLEDNQMKFVYGYLSEIIDRNGNKVVLLYDTDTYDEATSAWQPKSSTASGKNQLKKIIHIPDGASPITIASLNYDSENYLVSVTDRTGSNYIESDDRTVVLTNTQGYLTRIEDPDKLSEEDNVSEEDKVSAEYRYTAFPNRLWKVLDTEARHGLEFTYGSNGKSVGSYKDFTVADDVAEAEIRGTIDNPELWTVHNVMCADFDTQLSWFRHTGDDKIAETEDDIVTSYVFDTWGRTVTARTEDGDHNTLGTAGGSYTTNSGTSKKNNRIVKEGGTGVIKQNLAYNSGFEETANWSRGSEPYTEHSTSYSTEHAHTGFKSYKMTSVYAGQTLWSYQSITLPKRGMYTFSAYVKVTSMGTIPYSGGGFRIEIKDSDNITLASSRYITAPTATEIDNGWVRLSCSFNATMTTSWRPSLVLDKVSGTVYVDDVQFEYSDIASPYNIIQNGDFSKGLKYWDSRENAGFSSISQYDGTSGYAIKITGGPDKGGSHTAQVINVNLPGTETYMFSGWAKADSVPLNDPNHRSFQITAMLTYSDGTTEYFQNPFSHLVVNKWQYLCVPIIPDVSKTVSTITITCSYKGNANIAYFDDLFLIRGAANAYTYDDNGNVTSTSQTAADDIHYNYDGVDLDEMSGGTSGTTHYDYDVHHNVTTAINDSLTTTYTYDEVGNVVNTTVDAGGVAFMSSSATYTDGGTKTATETDNLGNTTSYSYNVWENLLTGVTVPTADSYSSTPTNITTNYSYDNAHRLLSAYITGKVSLDYTYNDKGQVETITRGGYIPTQVTGKINQIYTLVYNDYGQTTQTKIGNRTLSTNTYNDLSHNLMASMAGNGDVISYTYDKLDRVKTVCYNDINVMVTYKYDYMGNVATATVTNSAMTIEYATYSYEYDSNGRLVRYYETLDDDIVQQTEYTYDSKNRISSTAYYDGSGMRTDSVTYNDNGTVNEYFMGDGSRVTLGYDGFQRVGSKTYRRNGLGSSYMMGKKYTYKEDSETSRTTTLVSRLHHDFLTYGDDHILDYTYDAIGNITKVIDGDGNTVGRYLYDAQNQLVLEEVYPPDEEGYTMVYEYDTFGNIREARKYPSYGYDGPGQVNSYGTPIETETYTYGDADWKDLLTAYDGNAITYDAIGNPLSYYNGQNYTFTWENGRQLASAAVGNKTVSFEYNADGIRTEKHLSQTHDVYYRLIGDTVIEMFIQSARGNERLVFTYDDSGAPCKVQYYESETDTTPRNYYYMLNLQGDVIRLIDYENVTVANYTYDSWGNILSITDADGEAIADSGHIAHLNPIRYRSYFYDSETKLYYCNSRYYDPQMRRFINADVFASTGQGFLGYNMFAYAQNNPVMLIDPSGNVVSGWDKAHVKDINLINRLHALTDLWENTNYEADRIYAHEEAKKIREQFLNEGEYVGSNGLVYRDITHELNHAMIVHRAEFIDFINNSDDAISISMFFYRNVRSGGAWDLKVSWALDPDVLYVYGNKVLRYDALGNIHYGFVGAEYFTLDTLLKAADLAQTTDNPGATMDDPYDQSMIRFGVILSNSGWLD